MSESADLPLLVPLTHARVYKVKAQLLRRHGEGIHLVRRTRHQGPRVGLVLRQSPVSVQQRHTLRMAVHQVTVRAVAAAQLIGTPRRRPTPSHLPAGQIELHA